MYDFMDSLALGDNERGAITEEALAGVLRSVRSSLGTYVEDGRTPIERHARFELVASDFKDAFERGCSENVEFKYPGTRYEALRLVRIALGLTDDEYVPVVWVAGPEDWLEKFNGGQYGAAVPGVPEWVRSVVSEMGPIAFVGYWIFEGVTDDTSFTPAENGVLCQFVRDELLNTPVQMFIGESGQYYVRQIEKTSSFEEPTPTQKEAVKKVAFKEDDIVTFTYAGMPFAGVVAGTDTIDGVPTLTVVTDGGESMDVRLKDVTTVNGMPFSLQSDDYTFASYKMAGVDEVVELLDPDPYYWEAGNPGFGQLVDSKDYGTVELSRDLVDKTIEYLRINYDCVFSPEDVETALRILVHNRLYESQRTAVVKGDIVNFAVEGAPFAGVVDEVNTDSEGVPTLKVKTDTEDPMDVEMGQVTTINGVPFEAVPVIGRVASDDAGSAAVSQEVQDLVDTAVSEAITDAAEKALDNVHPQDLQQSFQDKKEELLKDFGSDTKDEPDDKSDDENKEPDDDKPVDDGDEPVDDKPDDDDNESVDDSGDQTTARVATRLNLLDQSRVEGLLPMSVLVYLPDGSLDFYGELVEWDVETDAAVIQYEQGGSTTEGSFPPGLVEVPEEIVDEIQTSRRANVSTDLADRLFQDTTFWAQGSPGYGDDRGEISISATAEFVKNEYQLDVPEGVVKSALEAILAREGEDLSLVVSKKTAGTDDDFMPLGYKFTYHTEVDGDVEMTVVERTEDNIVASTGGIAPLYLDGSVSDFRDQFSLGRIKTAELVKCPKCGGSGRVYGFALGEHSVQELKPCPVCHGTGKVKSPTKEADVDPSVQSTDNQTPLDDDSKTDDFGHGDRVSIDDDELGLVNGEIVAINFDTYVVKLDDGKGTHEFYKKWVGPEGHAPTDDDDPDGGGSDETTDGDQVTATKKVSLELGALTCDKCGTTFGIQENVVEGEPVGDPWPNVIQCPVCGAEYERLSEGEFDDSLSRPDYEYLDGTGVTSKVKTAMNGPRLNDADYQEAEDEAEDKGFWLEERADRGLFHYVVYADEALTEVVFSGTGEQTLNWLTSPFTRGASKTAAVGLRLDEGDYDEAERLAEEKGYFIEESAQGEMASYDVYDEGLLIFSGTGDEMLNFLTSSRKASLNPNVKDVLDHFIERAVDTHESEEDTFLELSEVLDGLSDGTNLNKSDALDYARKYFDSLGGVHSSKKRESSLDFCVWVKTSDYPHAKTFGAYTTLEEAIDEAEQRWAALGETVEYVTVRTSRDNSIWTKYADGTVERDGGVKKTATSIYVMVDALRVRFGDGVAYQLQEVLRDWDMTSPADRDFYTASDLVPIIDDNDIDINVLNIFWEFLVDLAEPEYDSLKNAVKSFINDPDKAFRQVYGE